jgi:hypothetical protein
MEKQFPYYSPNNLDFKLFGYKCIIEKQLIVDKQFIRDNNIKINIFQWDGLMYFVFVKNDMINEN